MLPVPCPRRIERAEMLFPQPLVCNEIGFNLIAPVFCSGQVRLHAPERRTISLNPDFSAARLYRIPVLPDHFRQAGDSLLVSPERSLEHQFLRGKPENDPAGIFRRRGFLPTVIARQISVLSGR